MATKAEVEQLTKIGKFWKYSFVLLARGKMSDEERDRILYNAHLTIDVISEEQVADLEKRL